MNENELMAAGGNLPVATGQMSLPELKEQVQIIQQVLRDVMKEGTHFDEIPGTGRYELNPQTGKKEYVKGKPVLLKAGAEKIGMVFRIGSEPEIERESDGFDTFFHIRTRMFDIRTGNTLGYGIGDGSTAESKYAWRKAVCHGEYESTAADRRRIHWQQTYSKDTGKKAFDKDGNPICEAIEQVRQNPADILNTCLKMACKRAEIDGIRKVTACSDVFDQDLDEDHIRNAVGADAEPEQPRYTQPQRKTPAPAPAPAEDAESAGNVDVITDNQRKRLYAIGKGRNLTDDEMQHIVRHVAGVERSGDIPRDRYNETVAAIEAAEPGKVF